MTPTQKTNSCKYFQMNELENIQQENYVWPKKENSKKINQLWQ